MAGRAQRLDSVDTGNHHVSRRSRSLRACIVACTALSFLAVTLIRTQSSRASSVDGRLQLAADKAMVGHHGSLVIVDILSKKILAAHQLELAAHLKTPPGSTLKPFVLMALLDSGKIDPAQPLICRRPLTIGSVKMNCSHPISITELNAEEAIAYSCNSYFAQVGLRLSPEELVQIFRRHGFASPSGLTTDEATGQIELPRSYEALQLEVLGDRGIEVTPLELLEAYRGLGERKLKGDIRNDGPVFAGLEESVTYGMAHGANFENWKIAGKTGTAASISAARTHGFFVGYAPAEKPRMAIVLYLENGRGMDAAALAKPVLAEFARVGRER